MRLTMQPRTSMTDDEVVALHRVICELVREGAALGWIDEPELPEIQDLVAELCAGTATGESCLVSAADDEGTLQGFAYWLRKAHQTEQPHADITKVALLPAARGGGNGRKLVQALIDQAKGEGVEVLTLDVRGNNHAAIAVYEKMGFVEYGRIPDYVAIGDERWDNVYMALDLRDPAEDELVRHGDAPKGPGASERVG